MITLTEYINQNWDKTVRYGTEDDGERIGLPKPYTVPCIDDVFKYLFYWDTYFTNVGLIHSGKLEYAINNTEDIAYLIDKYGYMPNANCHSALTRTQPPFFTLMVRDIYAITKDKAWLARMLRTAEREYDFWQNNRTTPSGLSRYSCDTPYPFDVDRVVKAYTRRLSLTEEPKDEDERLKFAQNCVTIWESGWDCTSRFGGVHNREYNWVDLNALLCNMEKDIASFKRELVLDGADVWDGRAQKRLALMNELMWNEKLGCFTDYDFTRQVQSDFISMASFYPMFLGLCTQSQAQSTRKLLSRLEFQYGISSCECRDDLLDFQWDYPHGWAPHHYIAVEGLIKYGFKDDALRIARKFAGTVERIFNRTGDIWEKYNVVTGESALDKEHDKKVTMMGWTAGVYIYLEDLLKQASE